MPNNNESSQPRSIKKKLFITIAIIGSLIGVVYAVYRSMLVKPEINQIEYGRRGDGQGTGDLRDVNSGGGTVKKSTPVKDTNSGGSRRSRRDK